MALVRLIIGKGRTKWIHLMKNCIHDKKFGNVRNFDYDHINTNFCPTHSYDIDPTYKVKFVKLCQ